VKIEFISSELLKNKSLDQKIDFIMKAVKKKKILVLEEALSNEEKKALITRSMEHINENFPGIEFSEISSNQDFLIRFTNSLGRLFFGKEIKKGLTVVGNSNNMKKLRESKDSISLLARVK
jgi:hypothetical protein